MNKKEIEDLLIDKSKEQNKWLNNEIKGFTDTEEEIFYCNIYKKIPLKIVPIFTEQDFMNWIDQKEFWKQQPNINKNSSSDDLVDAFITVQEQSLINSDWGNKVEQKGKWYMYYSEEFDTYFRIDRYMEDMFNECLVNILLYD